MEIDNLKLQRQKTEHHILALALLTPLLHGQTISEADRQRFEQIRAKVQRGERPTPEQRQLAQSILARMNQGHAAPKR